MSKIGTGINPTFWTTGKWTALSDFGTPIQKKRSDLR